MTDSELPYKPYGLKINPFVDRSARKSHLHMWNDREDQLRQWMKIISPPIDSNKIAIIIGNYGRGKSLSLLKIIDEADKHKEIFSVFMNLKTEEKSKPGLDFILRLLKSIDFDSLVEGKNKTEINKVIDRIPNDFSEPKEILKRVYDESEPTLKKLAVYFLKGEVKPSPTQLTHLGVMRKIENVDVAKEYLSAILNFIKGLGRNVLLVCVDEFEYLFSLVTKGQQSIYLALLRGLYDIPTGLEKDPGDIAKLVFFIAISEDGWTSLKEIENKERSSGGPTVPLVERIELITTLGTFDKHQTRDLIEKRLSYNRITETYADKPLIPFTVDFVDFIYETTRGEPRKILVDCAHVLDAGLAAKVHLLSKSFAQKTLEERGF